MPKKGEYFKFTDFERKIKATLCRFWKYSSRRGSEESYTNKYQKHVACSDGYNSVCVNVAYPFKLRISFKNFY